MPLNFLLRAGALAIMQVIIEILIYVGLDKNSIIEFSLFPSVAACLLISSLYTFYYRTKFTSPFIITTLTFHAILTLPAIGKFAPEGDPLIYILIQLAFFAGQLIFFYPCYWFGNMLTLTFITEYNKPIRLLDRPIALAFSYIVMFVISILFANMFNLTHVKSDIRIAFLFLFLLFIKQIIPSFIYTYFYQAKMTRKFKIIAICEMLFFLPIILIIFFCLSSAGWIALLRFAGNIQVSYFFNFIYMTRKPQGFKPGDEWSSYA